MLYYTFGTQPIYVVLRLVILIKYYCISCSVESNKSQSKNSLTEMLSLLHSFLMETTPWFWLLSFSILYTVEGVTPERIASVFTVSLVCNGIPTCTEYGIAVLTVGSLLNMRYARKLREKYTLTDRNREVDQKHFRESWGSI